MKAFAPKTDAGKRNPSARKNARHDIRNKTASLNETGPIMDLIQRLDCNGEEPSMEGVAGTLVSMPLARRQQAVLSLQKTRGNSFVQRLAIQAKLEVGSAGDKYEQEADRVADRVMRMAEPPNPVQRQEDEEGIQTMPLAASITPLAQRFTSFPIVQRLAEEEEKIETKVNGQELGSGLESMVQTARHGGQPLPKDLRAFFEPRFGQDFSQVRLHTDSQAAASARALKASAYTVGNDVVFGAGRYAPGTYAGRRLMAHELTHVFQQNPRALAKHSQAVRFPKEKAQGLTSLPQRVATNSKLIRSSPGDRLVREADQVAERVMGMLEPKVQRQKVPEEKEETQPLASQISPLIQRQAEPQEIDKADITSQDCPEVPKKKKVTSEHCRLLEIKAGTTPPADESETLPTISESPFGGDSEVAAFASSLSVCKAARKAPEEAKKRYKNLIKNEEAKAKMEAALESNQAIKDAIATSKGDRRARSIAKREAQAKARKKINDAKKAIVKPDVDIIEVELQAKYLNELERNFRIVTKDAGKNWQKVVEKRLASKEKRARKELISRIKKKRIKIPESESLEEYIRSAVEAKNVKNRCEERVWIENQIERAKYGWMVWVREREDFETKLPGKWQEGFEPPRSLPIEEGVQIPESIKAEKQKKYPSIAPEVADFLSELKVLEPDVVATNYIGHRFGKHFNSGYSVDLTLTGNSGKIDERGFYQRNVAIRFLLNLDKLAKRKFAKWRIIYNDFSVAEEINKETGVRNVTSNIFHGPSPIRLHFHLDITWKQAEYIKFDEP